MGAALADLEQRVKDLQAVAHSPLGTVDAAGLITFASDVLVTGDLGVGGTLGVDGIASFGSDIGVTGVSYLNGLAVIGGKAASTYEYDVWTTTFTGFSLGAGAQSSNSYTFTGGPSVGSPGIISLEAVWTLGAGFTAWTTGHRFSLPAGFAWLTGTQHAIAGIIHFVDDSAGVRYYGGAVQQGVNGSGVGVASIGRMQPTAATGQIRDSILDSSNPMTWASGDSIRVALVASVKRV